MESLTSPGPGEEPPRSRSGRDRGDPGVRAAWRWSALSIALLMLVAVSAAVTLLEASVLYGRLEVSPTGPRLQPGRWLFAAGAVLVPSVLACCTMVPWVLIRLAREAAQKTATQRTLEHAKSLLHRAEEVARMGHWQISHEPDGARVVWSDSIFEMLGHPPQSFEPTPEVVIASYHPDDREQVRSTLTRAMETGEPFEFEARALGRDERARIVKTQGRAERDASGRGATLFGVVRDVTEARARDAIVREHAELFRVITDGVSEAVILLDDARRVVSWNPAAQDLFGVSSDRARGRVFDQVVRLQQLEQGSTTLDLLPAADGADVHRWESVDPRGRRRTVEISEGRLEAGGPARSILLVRDVTKRVETERELRRSARYDELTSLLNRGYFWRRADEEVEKARDADFDRPLTLLLMDIDHFKSVNDERGHPEGDLALARFARCCADRFRSTDLLGRIGGEEFGVLLVGADAVKGRAIAEELRATIEALPIEGQTGRFGLTVSIGVAQVDLDDAAPLDDAGRRADEALYRAKSSGRNRVDLAPHPGGRSVRVIGDVRT